MSDIKEISTNTENADLTASAGGNADNTATPKKKATATAKKTTSAKSATTAKKTTSTKSATATKKSTSTKSATAAKKTTAKKADAKIAEPILDTAVEAEVSPIIETDPVETTVSVTETTSIEASPIAALLAESDDIDAEPEQINFDAYFKDFKEAMSEALASVSESEPKPSVDHDEAAEESSVTEAEEPAIDEPPAKTVTEHDVTEEETAADAPAEETCEPESTVTADLPDNFVPDFVISEDSDETAEEADETVDMPVAEETPTEEPVTEAEEIAPTEENEAATPVCEMSDEASVDDGQIAFDFESAKEANDLSAPLPERRNKDKFDPEHPRLIDTVFEFVELFAFTFISVLLITTFFVRYSTVEGGSMDKTLADGDNLIISGLFYTPERGDIIVFEDYSTELREPLVKRVIGIAGDKVVIDINGDVHVNGELLDEPYVHITPGKDPTSIFGTWTVGEGELFVLGDHRDISKDSREFGTIKADSVLGEVKLRFYPFDKFGLID